MEEELKPCPFCGEEPKMQELADRKRFRVMCMGKCHNVALIAYGKENVTEAWNTRTNTPKNENDIMRALKSHETSVICSYSPAFYEGYCRAMEIVKGLEEKL